MSVPEPVAAHEHAPALALAAGIDPERCFRVIPRLSIIKGGTQQPQQSQQFTNESERQKPRQLPNRSERVAGSFILNQALFMQVIEKL